MSTVADLESNPKPIDEEENVLVPQAPGTAASIPGTSQIAHPTIRKASSGFTNLKKYLTANKDNNLIGAVAGGAQTQLEGAQKQLQQSQQQFQTGLASEKGKLQGAVGEAEKARQYIETGAQPLIQDQAPAAALVKPTEIRNRWSTDTDESYKKMQDDYSAAQSAYAANQTARDEFNAKANAEAAAKLSQLKNYRYGGPQELGGAAQIAEKQAQLQDYAKATGSELGRGAILQTLFGKQGQYTAGSRNLDNLLLGSNQSNLDKLRALRAQTTGFGQNIKQAQQQATAGMGTARGLVGTEQASNALQMKNLRDKLMLQMEAERDALNTAGQADVAELTDAELRKNLVDMAGYDLVQQPKQANVIGDWFKKHQGGMIKPAPELNTPGAVLRKGPPLSVDDAVKSQINNYWSSGSQAWQDYMNAGGDPDGPNAPMRIPYTIAIPGAKQPTPGTSVYNGNNSFYNDTRKAMEDHIRSDYASRAANPVPEDTSGQIGLPVQPPGYVEQPINPEDLNYINLNMNRNFGPEDVGYGVGWDRPADSNLAVNPNRDLVRKIAQKKGLGDFTHTSYGKPNADQTLINIKDLKPLFSQTYDDNTIEQTNAEVINRRNILSQVLQDDAKNGTLTPQQRNEVVTLMNDPMLTKMKQTPKRLEEQYSTDFRTAAPGGNVLGALKDFRKLGYENPLELMDAMNFKPSRGHYRVAGAPDTHGFPTSMDVIPTYNPKTKMIDLSTKATEQFDPKTGHKVLVQGYNGAPTSYKDAVTGEFLGRNGNWNPNQLQTRPVNYGESLTGEQFLERYAYTPHNTIDNNSSPGLIANKLKELNTLARLKELGIDQYTTDKGLTLGLDASGNPIKRNS